MKVEKSRIDKMLNKIEFKNQHIKGTNVTVALAMIDGFSIATGQSACVDDENFNAELGAIIAIDRARKEAENKLWEFEGYVNKFYGSKEHVHLNTINIKHVRKRLREK